MNASECDALVADVAWGDPYSLIILTILFLITLMVIVGNILVVAAVYMSSKLRTVTNLFIVSLAVADLLVGVAVLPFSAPLEVFKVWIFGDIWCSIWLAVDVWMCTASILNLCAISLDRYVAVTTPLKYPSIMSSSRAKYLIAGVWILSFVICFPPLVGWKDPGDGSGVPDIQPTVLSGLGTVRIRGTHTVITGYPNATDNYPNLIAYHTNFSEHIIETFATKRTPDNFDEDSRKLKAEIYKYNENMLPFEDKPSKTDLYLEPEVVVKRAVSAFSGVPVISGDMFDMVSASSEPTGPPEPSGGPPPAGPHHCPWVCELTSAPGYVIYSALGSFFIPMCVMLFFYWRIYCAAVSTTKAINQGFRTTKGTGGIGNRFDEQRLTLRIHRGRGSVQNHSSACSSHTNLTTNGGHSSLSASPSTASTGKSPEPQRLARTNRHENVKISVSYPSSDQINALPASNAPSPRPADKTYLTPTLRRSSLSSPKKAKFSVSPQRKSFIDLSLKKFAQPKNEVFYSVHYLNKNGREVTESAVCRSKDPNCYLRVSGSRLGTGRRSLSIDSTNSAYDDESTSCSRRNSTKSQTAEEGTHKDLSPSPTFDDHPPIDTGQKAVSGVPKMNKRNIKPQVKRIRMETKAAKTLAIIVGGFILCWMPFFTIYLVRAFCVDCINPIVFSVLFWLGYCNSAINPLIYALFSKDFRFAFKKIICRCLCGKEQPMNLNLKRRGSDASNVKTPMYGRKRSLSHHPPNCLGDDSDPGGSDSR